MKICQCATCDFDRRMMETLPRSQHELDTSSHQALVLNGNKRDQLLGINNPVAFAYNMEEYITVLLEDAGEWCQSYH